MCQSPSCLRRYGNQLDQSDDASPDSVTLDQTHLIELVVWYSPRFFSRKPWRTLNG
ncbi:hypothetical protein RBWH47_03440 [Rhodopirellula baltica WH47]|uniref:Uncharacterized protein n=1 Tax=Rhodopirellula baltica WH47 TaxID=991778 RepID=F2B1U8_RHOBT|nr:hypothetical protein RBWH47_03440 [Rhodopirellula baltica WH47]